MMTRLNRPQLNHSKQSKIQRGNVLVNVPVNVLVNFRNDKSTSPQKRDSLKKPAPAIYQEYKLFIWKTFHSPEY